MNRNPWYGKAIAIVHKDGTVTVYAHLYDEENVEARRYEKE